MIEEWGDEEKRHIFISKSGKMEQVTQKEREQKKTFKKNCYLCQGKLN